MIRYFLIKNDRKKRERLQTHLESDETFALFAVPQICHGLHMVSDHLLLGRIVELVSWVGPVGRDGLVVEMVHGAGEEVVVSVGHGFSLHICRVQIISWFGD